MFERHAAVVLYAVSPVREEFKLVLVEVELEGTPCKIADLIPNP